MEASHFKGRRCKSVRWDEENVDAVCRPCHRLLGENPDAYVEFKIDQLGQEKYQALILRANTIRKWKPWELEELRKELREGIREIENV